MQESDQLLEQKRQVMALLLYYAYPEFRDFTTQRSQDTVVAPIGIGLNSLGDQPSLRSRGNAIVATAIYCAGIADSMLSLSLNIHPKTRLSEAEAMAQIAREFVNDGDLYFDPRVLAEDETDNTIKNVFGLRQMILEHGWKNIILVAQQDHAWRVQFTAKWILRDLNVQVVTIYVKSDYEYNPRNLFEMRLPFRCREVCASAYTLAFAALHPNYGKQNMPVPPAATC